MAHSSTRQAAPAHSSFGERISRAVNDPDIVMGGPLADIFVVCDTNILLHFFDVLQRFIDDLDTLRDKAPLSVTVVIPGIVISELDAQKNRDGLSWFARRASQWILQKIQQVNAEGNERPPLFKGQANYETCKESGNWRVQDSGELALGRSNDDLIRDACQYFDDLQPGRTLLLSRDNNLCIEVIAAGMHSLCPPAKFGSRDLARALFGNHPSVEDFGSYRPRYMDPCSSRAENLVRKSNQYQRDDGMDVDGDPNAPCDDLLPYHALDLLHLQVTEHFGALLTALAVREGAQLVSRRGNDSVSSYAPEYAKITLPEWQAADCLAFLATKKGLPTPVGSPPISVYLRKPYEKRKGIADGRRGQDWSKQAWLNVLDDLKRLGEAYGDSSITESIGMLEPHVTEVFERKMRPSGT